MFARRRTAIVSLLLSCAALLSCAQTAHSQQQYYGPAPVRDPRHIARKHVASWKQLRENNVVMQRRDFSCGAAALATLVRYYWGDAVSEEYFLRQLDVMLTPAEMTDRIQHGLSITDLRKVSVQSGYLATIGTLSFPELLDSKVPLVVPISPDGYDHFVVFRGGDGQHVYLADPLRGNIRIASDKFVKQWQRNAILVVAKPGQPVRQWSPLSVHCGEVNLGRLNWQVIRTQPSRSARLRR